MPSTQKALLLEKKLGDFVIGETEVYKPGAGEILIKVQSTALNPVDWKIQKYGGFVEDFPAILGTGIAGDVEEVGEGVTDFKKGDRVFAQGQMVKRKAGFQQYAVSAAAITTNIPSNLSYDEVAIIPVALSAAYVGLYDENPHGFGFAAPVSETTRGKYAGVPLVIFGGTSTVGQFVIQLAKLSGFSPVITTASSKNLDLLQSLGATHVFDRNLPTASLVAEIAKVTNGKPINFIYDAIALKGTQQTALDILAPGGSLALVMPPVVEVPKDKTVIRVLAIYQAHNADLLKTLYHDNLYAFLEQGAIKPNEVEVIPNGLAGIPVGLAKLEANQVSRKKLVVHPQETA
ncbi:chaperonin 10-like protein [Flammula alnicola]|nr:chaperonin 10-like protein [Flammula alnicola]